MGPWVPRSISSEQRLKRPVHILSGEIFLFGIPFFCLVLRIVVRIRKYKVGAPEQTISSLYIMRFSQLQKIYVIYAACRLLCIGKHGEVLPSSFISACVTGFEVSKMFISLSPVEGRGWAAFDDQSAATRPWSLIARIIAARSACESSFRSARYCSSCLVLGF